MLLALILDCDDFKIMWHFGASKTKMNIDMSAEQKNQNRGMLPGSPFLFRNTADEHDWFVNDMRSGLLTVVGNT